MISWIVKIILDFTFPKIHFSFSRPCIFRFEDRLLCEWPYFYYSPPRSVTCLDLAGVAQHYQEPPIFFSQTVDFTVWLMTNDSCPMTHRQWSYSVLLLLLNSFLATIGFSNFRILKFFFSFPNKEFLIDGFVRRILSAIELSGSFLTKISDFSRLEDFLWFSNGCYW